MTIVDFPYALSFIGRAFKSAMLPILLTVGLDANAQRSPVDSLEQLLSKSTVPKERAHLLNTISFEVKANDFLKSKEYALQARAIAEHYGFTSELGTSYIRSGNADYFLGDHDQAMTDYMKALEIFENSKDSLGIIDVLNEVATLQKKHNDLETSEKNLLRALDLSRQTADSGRVANSLNNLGHCYELKGDLDKAMSLYKESTVLKEARKDWYGASFNYDNMANILSARKKFDEAEKYYQKEMEIFRRINDRMNYAIAVNNLGEMYNLKGELTKARTYFNQSLEISLEVGFKDLTRHIYSMLSATYEKEGDFRNAFAYYVKSAAMKDSIFNEQKSKQILDIEKKYETEKKESQIKLLQQDNKIKDFGLRQNRLFILGLVLALFAIIIVGVLLLNRIKLKQSIELEATRASLRESQLQAVIKSQEEERRRFAADLHDGLGQIISALRLNLSREVVEERAVDHALNLLNEMNNEIRNIAFNLMPHALMTEGLEPALQQFCARINRSGKMSLNVSAFNLSQEMASDQKIALYRICQEWVNNVMKYSGADVISIQLVQHPDELLVTIEDNGNGFDTSSLTKSKGNGWKNINSRAALIKGQLDIDSVPGRKGTTLLLSAPLYSLATP